MLISILSIPLRIAISIGAMIVWYMENLIDWLIGLKSKTEYVKRGNCKKCGQCCRLLAIYVPRPLGFMWKWLAAWHRIAYNFEYVSQEDGWHLYKCRYLNKKGRCSIYLFRHRLCRSFPTPGLYGRPYMHEDCGFYFDRRDGKPDFKGILKDKTVEKKYQINC